ncbi:MAG TPA: T9SS type A sorting domain-containing protein [Bacteroidales bacterium]|nr:MAG: hypothetical protein BWX63_01343 [Bacteroidetes bacterium ADurb.Bin041]HPW43823.1 T9SS type A sorting domain-containing protein [Bacteroidales bacterium]
MKKTLFFAIKLILICPFGVLLSQNYAPSPVESVLWNETTNSQGNQDIYYYPFDSNDSEVKPIDYVTSETIIMATYANNRNTAGGLPTILDGSSKVIPYSRNQRWEVFISQANMNLSPQGRLIESYDKGLVVGAASFTNLSNVKQWSFKTDINGQILYDNMINHNNYGLGIWAFTQDSDGNLYAAGGIFFFDNTYIGMPLITKFNPCGEPVWCRALPVTPQSYQGTVLDIIINSNNDLIALVYQSTGGAADEIYLAAFNLDGKELWIRPYAKKSDYPLMLNRIGRKLIEHRNGYYIAGYCYYPFPGNPIHVFLRPLFIGINSDFKEKWVKPFYALDSVFGIAETIIPINDSVLMGGGIRRATFGEDANSLLMFITTDGNEIGYSQIRNYQIGSEIKVNYISELERVNDSLFIAASVFGTHPGVNPVGEFIIDTSCNLYNFQSRPNTETKPSMVKTYDNNFVINANIKVGNYFKLYLYKIDSNLESVPLDTTQYVYDSLCPHTIQSGTIDLTDCLVIQSIDELPSPDEYYESIRWIPVKAYPNPVSGQELTIEFENTQHHSNIELRLYDAFGKEVHRRRIYTGQQDISLDVGHWPPGLYLVVVYSNGGAVGQCKVVVE